MAEPVALIDYGAGNLHSVANALKAAGAAVTVTADPDVVAGAERIVLPGVGSFRACMDGLAAIDGLVPALERRVRRQGAPFLGICVGMQLLAGRGLEHGETPGLGWIGGEVRLITPIGGISSQTVTSGGSEITTNKVSPAIKVPHMGWNVVSPARDGLIAPGEAYFLHSYQFFVSDTSDIAATTDHGGGIVAAVARDNILGVQFHPEKSQSYGLELLKRFLRWAP